MAAAKRGRAEQKTRLSVAAYARHRKSKKLPGGTETGVRNAIRDGRITRGVDGKIDPAVADEEWAANTGRPGPKPKTADYEVERAREQRAKADLREIELAEKRGELTNAAENYREGFKLGNQIQQTLLALPDRLAPEYASMDDIRAIALHMKAALREALAALSALEDAE